MKSKLALFIGLSLGAQAFAAVGPVALDPAGPVTFGSSSVDCSKNTLTVMRAFRAEGHSVRADLCQTIQQSNEAWNLLGFDDQGVVNAIGYTENGQEKLVVSSQ